MTDSPDERLTAARQAIAALVAAVTNEGPRGSFWLVRLQQLQDILTRQAGPAEEMLAEAAERERLLYSAARDNFSDFYLKNVDPQQRVAENGRFVADADTLHTALTLR
jgi:hypothetical protein